MITGAFTEHNIIDAYEYGGFFPNLLGRKKANRISAR